MPFVLDGGSTNMGGLKLGLLGENFWKSWNGVTAFGYPFRLQVMVQGKP